MIKIENNLIYNMKKIFKQIITAHSGISSKRFCGLLSWIVVLGIFIYATIAQIEVPSMSETLMICASALLGVDSITSAFKKSE